MIPDVVLLIGEYAVMIFILHDVIDMELTKLSAIIISLCYFLNALAFRLTRLNQTLGDVLFKLELRNNNGQKPGRSKLIVRDLLVAISILNTANGLFSALVLLIYLVPVGRHKGSGHFMIMLDIIFRVYYDDASLILHKDDDQAMG